MIVSDTVVLLFPKDLTQSCRTKMESLSAYAVPRALCNILSNILINVS